MLSYRDDGLAVGISVPCLLVYFERPFGHEEPYKGRHFAGEVVYFVGVLAGRVLAAEQRVVGERLVLQHLDALAAARVLLRRLSHAEQLRHLVLQTKILSNVTFWLLVLKKTGYFCHYFVPIIDSA